MTDFDTLRWGDKDSLSFFVANNPASNTPIQNTKQLVHAYWRRPLTWKLLVYIAPMLPASETGTFLVTANVTIGIGQSISDTMPFAVSIAPVAGLYAPSVTVFDIPAQDIQVNMTVNASGATQESESEYWSLSAFAAPFTEPYGYTVVGDFMMGPEGTQHQPRVTPDQIQAPRWMPPGFVDGHTRYRR